MSSSDDAPDRERDHHGLLYLLPELFVEVAEWGLEVAEAAKEELPEEVAFHANENADPCPYPGEHVVMDPWLIWKF